MKKRDVIFFASFFGVVLGITFIFSGKTPPKTELALSDLFPIQDSENPKNDQQQVEVEDFRTQLQKRLQLSQDILEEHTYDLPEMIKERKIRVLTTYTFGNYFVYDGKAFGFEYNLMEEFEKFLNKGKKRSDHVIFYYFPLPYELLIPGIKQGYGDIIAANLTIIPERIQELDFTDPYQWNIKEVLVSHKSVEGIRSIEDLSGREVHVREDSSYQYSLERLNEQLKQKKLDPVKIVKLPGLINTGEIIEWASSNVIDLTVSDTHIASIAEELLPNIKVYGQIVFNDDVRFGWMVRKNNPQLKSSLNQFIKTIKTGTLLGNIYFKRYFKENPWVRESLKREDLDKFSQYAPLFKKYGDMYGVDWMLVEAQAFQESGLNPDARSHMGAVGLMQLLPSTAKYVGFDDIRSVENNIHAGVKYLKYLMDQHFPEDQYSPTDRLRITLAAYNAGPGNMKRSIRKTAELGYDPTKWFGNIEMGTLRQVGLEPVHYVRNINKFYLSFLISDILKGMKEELIQQRLENLKKGDQGS
jgi:membrane-bound lytic murein transglycosylase MltF